MRKTFATYQEVIDLLKKDCEIFTHLSENFGKQGQLVYSSRVWEVSDCKEINKNIHHATVEKLKKNKVILASKPYTFLGDPDGIKDSDVKGQTMSVAQMKKLTVKICDSIKREMDIMNESYAGSDVSDIGNAIGMAVGKHIANKEKFGYEKNDFLSGFNHGYSLKDGTHG